MAFYRRWRHADTQLRPHASRLGNHAFERELVIGRGSPQDKLSNVCCLTGVGLGLTASYLKPVETEQLRDSLRQIAEMTAQLPLLLRMGRGSHAGHSPRRPIQEHVS